MKKSIYLILISGLLLLLSCHKKSPTEPPNENIHPQVDIPWPSLADSPWPMFHHDPQSTGRSQYVGPRKGKIKWTFTPGGLIFSSVVIGSDHTIYFPSHYEASPSGQKSYLYAVTPDGLLKWKIQLELGSEAQPIVVADGTIFIAAGPNHDLYAINPDGSIKQIIDLGEFFISPFLNIGIDGTLFFPGSDGYLYAMSQQGQILWKSSKDDGFSMVNMPISPDGNTIYYYKWDKLLTNLSLCALNAADGKIKWEYQLSENEWGTYSPLVDVAGNIYFGTGGICQQPGFYSLAPDGIMNWKYPGWCVQEPTIDHNGRIYFQTGTNIFILTCLDYTGMLVRENELGLPNRTTYICDVDGIVYCCNEREVIAYNQDGKQSWHVPLTGYITRIASPAIDADGTLYVGTYADSSKLFAIN